MSRLPISTRAGCVVAAALLLASCSTAIGGSGHQVSGAALPSQPAGSTSATGFPSQAPTAPVIPTQLRRTVTKTAIGDPGRVDPCELLPVTIGTANLLALSMQAAGSCAWSVSASSGAKVGYVNVVLMDPSFVTRIDGTRTTVHGLPVVKPAPESQGCDRYLTYKGVAFDVRVTVSDGSPACTWDDTATDDVAAALTTGKAMSTRNFGTASVADANMCAVMRAAAFDTSTQFSGAQLSDYLLGTACEISGEGSSYALLQAMESGDPATVESLTPVKELGRTLYEDLTDGCTEYAEQLTDGPVPEVLSLFDNASTDCADARQLLVSALVALGR